MQSNFSMTNTTQYAAQLFKALQNSETIAPLVQSNADLSINDAYAISLEFLEHRLKNGEKVIGKKIGVTSKAVQDMLGVFQPDFGFLTDVMHIDGDINIKDTGLIQPRAEAEIAFILKDSLHGPRVSAQDVMAATQYIVPSLEIVDSRIDDWNISIIDTVADNASCGVFILGNARANPNDHDLPALKVSVTKNGQPLSEGLGSSVQGNPAEAVAWLANTLGQYGVSLDAGDIILSGSLVPLEPAVKGDIFEMTLHGIGNCTAKFI